MRVLGQHCAEEVSFAFCETLLFSWDFVSDGSRTQANAYRDAENNEGCNMLDGFLRANPIFDNL
jgi:hypothetical protein